MNFYIPTTRGNRHTDTYVFIPSKFELPANAAADRVTKALEEFTAAMKSKRNRDIPFTKKSINDAISVLSKLFQPTTQAATNATRPRVSEVRVQRPRVDDNNNNNNNNNNNARPPRVLRPQQQVHRQKYLRGTRVYRMFGEPIRLVEHRGYIYGFDEKEGYYTVKY